MCVCVCVCVCVCFFACVCKDGEFQKNKQSYFLFPVNHINHQMMVRESIYFICLNFYYSLKIVMTCVEYLKTTILVL